MHICLYIYIPIFIFMFFRQFFFLIFKSQNPTLTKKANFNFFVSRVVFGRATALERQLSACVCGRGSEADRAKECSNLLKLILFHPLHGSIYFTSLFFQYFSKSEKRRKTKRIFKSTGGVIYMNKMILHW